LYARQAAELPPGRRKFGFLFEGAAVAAAGKREWRFSAELGCGREPDRAHLPAATLNLDPVQYERAHGALIIQGLASLQQDERDLSPSYWTAGLSANGKRAGTPLFKLTSVPEGFDASLREVTPGLQATTLIVKVAPGTPPGRYFIGVTATSGDETASREFVLDLPSAAQAPVADTHVVTLPSPNPTTTAPAPAEVSPAAASKVYTQRIRIAGDVMAKKLLPHPAIQYPLLAATAGIQGVVRFTAIIATDGTIENLQLISGHPLLVSAAQAAVSQWLYRPTLLNGVPAEVITQVEVDFHLPEVQE
jgi:TonB family protein